MGMFFAMAMVLSFFEGMVVIPGLPPGVKLGLSNLAVMYGLFFLGAKSAFTLAVLKSGFVFLTRGAISGFLSLSGGLLSILVMALVKGKKENLSYIMLSIFGAVSHNLGQLIASRMILNQFLYYYFPILLISGVLMGVLTGTTLGYLMPYFKKIDCCFGTMRSE